MTRAPSLAKAFIGRWRIVEMANWDDDIRELDEQAHLTFSGAANGEVSFGTLKGFLDVRYGTRDGSACAEFTWVGHDDEERACGRGWVTLDIDGRLVGHVYVHKGEDSGVMCERD